jgi:hypothetical protein
MNRFFLAEKFFETRKVGTDLFRVRRTDPDTLSAGDASLRNDRSLAVNYADRLAMTMPDAFVAVLALVFNSIYRFKYGAVHFYHSGK